MIVETVSNIPLLQAINPKPSAPIDMASMLAAAQQHMQVTIPKEVESMYNGKPQPS